jgi:hypothetical protein
VECAGAGRGLKAEAEGFDHLSEFVGCVSDEVCILSDEFRVRLSRSAHVAEPCFS